MSTRHGVLYVLLAVGLLALFVYLAVESHRHRRNLDAIPTRILVNGIRGKSSVTRLIFGALHTQMVTIGKTTGTAARIILPAGHEKPIHRRHGLVNVIEQVGVVARAVAAGAQALVIECMAVDPELQELNQAQLIRSSIGVLTNVRMDHVAEMGPTLQDIARSLSRSMPHGGVCVTAEVECWPILQAEAKRRKCRLMYADPEQVTDAELDRFGYITFKENIAIALVVSDLCGIDRRTALEGMILANPDPGVLRVDRVAHAGRTFDSVNLFAANDPNSTMANIALLRDRGLLADRVSIVINCRPDRVERNGQMGELIAAIDPSSVFVIGSPTGSAVKAIASSHHGLVTQIDGEHHDGPSLLARITADLPAGDHSLILIGNIHGRGEILLDALAAAAWTSDDDLAFEALTQEFHLDFTQELAPGWNGLTLQLAHITVGDHR